MVLNGCRQFKTFLIVEEVQIQNCISNIFQVIVIK